MFKPEHSSLLSRYKASLNVTLDIPQEMVFISVFCFLKKRMIHEGKRIFVVVRKRVVAASDRSIKQPLSSQSPP